MSTADVRSMTISSSEIDCDELQCIERLVLPPTGMTNTRFTEPEVTFSKLNATAGKPYVGLLFVAPGMYWGRKENHKLEQEVAEAYGRYFSGKLIAVGCNECQTEGSDGLRSCAGPLGPATGTPALLFWPREGLQVHVSHDDIGLHRYTCGVQNHLLPNLIEAMVDQLGFDDQQESTLLVFVNAFPANITATACLFNSIQSKCKGKKMNLWGGYCNDDMSTAEIVEGKCLVKGAMFAVIRLTGHRLDSAVSIIRCSEPRWEVSAQLRRLKNSLKRRQNYLLLMSGPVDISTDEDGYQTCKEFKAAARRIFSRDMQILGAFNNMPHAIGIDSDTQGDKEDQRYLWHNCMSVMALSYD